MRIAPSRGPQIARARTAPAAQWPRLGFALWAVVVSVAACAMTLAPRSAAAAEAGSRGSEVRNAERRMLVFAVPDLTWREVRDANLPNLRAFADNAALASLAQARTQPHRRGPGDYYVTIGAGTRSVGNAGVDGAQFERSEIVRGMTAGDRFRNQDILFADRPSDTPDVADEEVAARSRITPDSGGAIVSLRFPAIVAANEEQPYDSVPGAVVAELRELGVATAVIANADQAPGPRFAQRQAALALTGPDGTLDDGEVTRSLLRPDPSAPFGVRTDEQAVNAAFTSLWQERGPRVVLVEASDLQRVAAYSTIGTEEDLTDFRTEALINADRLFGSLLEHVDRSHDDVLVIGVQSGRLPNRLGAVMLAGPGVEPGYLASASSQRTGVVSIVDVGPAILDRFGGEYTKEMEGRPFRTISSGDSFERRADRFVREADGARARSEIFAPAAIAHVILLALCAVVVATATIGRRWWALAQWFALTTLLCLPMTYLVHTVPFTTASPTRFLLCVFVLAALLATLVLFLFRSPLARVAVACSLVAGTLLVDAITGAHLQYNAVWGYSATVNSRLYGVSNYSFGQIVAATLTLSGIIASRLGSTRGWWAATGLLGCTLVVVGMPIWGSDVGGVLAGTPTFLLFLLLIRGRKIRLRTALLAASATAVAIGIFAAVDLMRPAKDRSHLGRLFERIGTDGWGSFLSIVHRKFLDSIRESTTSVWVLALPIGIVIVAVLLLVAERPLARWVRAVPTLRAVLISCGVGALLGSALNDSGAIVAGTLAYTLSTVMAVLSMQVPAAPPAAVELDTTLETLPV